MLLHDILGLSLEEEIFLAEESLEDLLDLSVTEEILSSGIDPSERIIVRSDKGLEGVAIHLKDPTDFWLFLTDRYSDKKVLQGFLKDCSREVQADDNSFLEAIIEYFSLALAGELLCESCTMSEPPAYQQDRIERLEALLKRELPEEMSLLEIGCGDGTATQAMRNLGLNPLSMDNDRCYICQAIKAGLLDPRRAFIMDARLLEGIFAPESFDAVLGFMVGMIDSANWHIWKEILVKSSGLARKMVIFTVYTRKEADIIAKAMAETGWEGKIIDNRDRNGIYDQWAYIAEKKC